MDTAIAQTAATTAPVTSTAGPSILGGGNIMVLAWVMIAALFYFMIMNPNQKERKKRDEMLNSIQRGDKVLTRGGVYGIVADIKEQVIVLKIAENTKIEIERSFIETVQKPS